MNVGQDECLTQVFKKRCPNLVVRRSLSTHQRRRSIAARRCDIDFLPLVYVDGETPLQSQQRLLCSNDVDGFAPCPLLRSWNETSELICDPLSTNNKRCDSTQELVKTRCRLFETCDQAVLLSGGWNWQLSGRRETHHLLSMYRMLRHNGFGKHSVKIFFANGVRPAKGTTSVHYILISRTIHFFSEKTEQFCHKKLNFFNILTLNTKMLI